MATQPTDIAAATGVRARRPRAGRFAWLGRPVPQSVRLAAFALLLFVPTLLEIALAERKFGILRGGFGAPHVVNGAGEWIVFVLTLGCANFILAALVWRAIAWAHGRRWNGWLFVALAGPGAAALLSGAILARYEVMRYFSDALSFRLIQQLGGGSLVDAALYLLEGGWLGLILALGLLVLAGFALRALARRDLPPAGGKWLTPVPLRAAFVTTIVLFPALLMAADRTGDVRWPLGRFVSVSMLRGALAQITDFDRDGYGAFSMLPDPAPFDAARYPLALDIPGNGVDEDGIAGDFTAPDPAPAHAALALPDDPPNLLVIVVETMRGDVIGKRVNGKPVAPNLERLARRGGTVPTYSHIGFTTASLKSLFTGRLEPAGGESSLFGLLNDAGYRIGVFSGQPETFGNIAGVTGMSAHADVLVDANVLKDERAGAFAAQGSLRIPEKTLLKAFDARFGKAEDWREPVFLYVNFQSPHFPYWHEGMTKRITDSPLERSEIVPERRAELEETYWNAVAHADHYIGALLARLEALGERENTLVMVVGDHGESLFDDGFLGHGHLLNDSQTRTVAVFDRPVLASRSPAGLSDLRDILVDALSGRKANPAPRAILQYIGTLDRPDRVALIGEDGKRTVFDPQKRLWSFAGGPETPLDDAGEADRARAERLVHAWSSARWRRHEALSTD